MGKKKDLVGERFGSLVVVRELDELVDYNAVKKRKITRRFFECKCDCGGVIQKTYTYLIAKGYNKSCGCTERINKRKPNILNRQTVWNVGVNDYEGSIYDGGKLITPYSSWQRMLKRCYSGLDATYVDSKVHPQWLLFSNFKKWFDEHYVEGYELDKDILVKGNKIYSPDTCCFVPHEINTLVLKSERSRGVYPIGVSYEKVTNKYRASMTIHQKHIAIGRYCGVIDAFNAYKQAKEAHIKEMADKWKGKIANNVYQALYNYKIEITD